MIPRVRNMQPGELFVLKRTHEAYALLRREHGTPGGTRYVVRKHGEQRESSLHHSCHVWPITGAHAPHPLIAHFTLWSATEAVSLIMDELAQ